MKAITIRQPWAWAVLHGGKDVENRTQCWTYRGPLAIHTGRAWSARGGVSELVWQALEDRYGWPTGPISARDDPRPGFDVIRPLGAVIGIVDLVDVHTAEPGCCDSPWAEQQYQEASGRRRRDITHLVLAHPRPCVPIPARGRQGLWDFDQLAHDLEPR